MITKEGNPISVYIDVEFLGGVISEKSTCTNDIKRKMGLALGKMQKLTAIWKSVFYIATYGSESWTRKKRDEHSI